MKYLLIITTILLSKFCYSQQFYNRTLGTTTPNDPFLSSSRAFYMPRSLDTTLNGGLDSIGALTYDRIRRKIWVRDSVLLGGHKWTQIFKQDDTATTLATRYDLTQLSSTVLNNIGTGFNWVATPSGNIKRVANSNTILWDSTSNANGLTPKADTSVLATQYDLTQISLTLAETQIGFGGPLNTLIGENAFTYLSTNTLNVDSIRVKSMFINPDTLTSNVILIGNAAFNSNADSVGAHSITQTQTQWGSTVKDVDYVLGIGYNDDQSPYYKPNAGSLYDHWESEYFDRLERIMVSKTYSGFTQRFWFSHHNKFNGGADLSLSFSDGVQIKGIDTVSHPYFTVSNGVLTNAGLNGYLDVTNKNLNTGQVFSNFRIAPQSDGSTIVSTAGTNPVIQINNQIVVSSTAQSNIKTSMVNANTYGIHVEGSGTGTKYPIFSQIDIVGTATAYFENVNGGSSSNMAIRLLSQDGGGDPYLQYYTNGASKAAWTGIDNSDGDKYKASIGGNLFTDDVFFTADWHKRVGIHKESPVYGFDINGTVGLNKDSITHITSIGANELLTIDTINGNVKRILPANLGVTTLYTGDGTLAGNRTISTGGFTTTWTGSNDGETSFSVVNTGTTAASAIAGTASGTTSIGVSGTSTSYLGVYGSSTSNNGIQGESSSGTGVVGVSATGAAFRGQINPTSTNAIENIVTLLRTTSSGAGANSIGAAIQYELETATNGTSQIAGSIAFKWTDATNATRTSQFEVYGVNSTTSGRKLALAGTGKLTLDGYGSGTFTGTPTYTLQVDASGNIIEQSVSLSPIISSGTAAPATTPGKVGDIYVDTNNKKLYFATGTSSSADWTIAN